MTDRQVVKTAAKHMLQLQLVVRRAAGIPEAAAARIQYLLCCFLSASYCSRDSAVHNPHLLLCTCTAPADAALQGQRLAAAMKHVAAAKRTILKFQEEATAARSQAAAAQEELAAARRQIAELQMVQNTGQVHTQPSNGADQQGDRQQQHVLRLSCNDSHWLHT